MKTLFEELQKEKKDIEIWTHPLDSEDSGIYGGVVERIFDDGVLIKEDLKKVEEKVFIPFREIIRIIIWKFYYS